MSTRKPKQYSEEFKQEAVRLALESGNTKAAIARDLNICVSLLYTWIKKYDEAKVKGLTPAELDSEKKQMRQLQAEIKALKTENAILKKAAAYFAKEQL